MPADKHELTHQEHSSQGFLLLLSPRGHPKPSDEKSQGHVELVLCGPVARLPMPLWLLGMRSLNITYYIIFILLHKFLLYTYTNTYYALYKLAGKPTFGELPFSSATTTACRRLSADASMLCDGVSWAVCCICNVMCAWHVSMQGEH